MELIENIISRINKLENERDITIEGIATIKIKISEFMDILKNNNYDSIISELKDESDDMYNSVEAIYAIIDDLE